MADHAGKRVGQQLGNYQLTRLLGEGGFAEVYLGEHIYLGTEAAIKVLYTQLTSDDMDRFRSEARTVARLIHPHIVRVLEFGIEGKTPFLVMDYAPNGTLRQRHPRGTPVPLATVISYVKQIADALQYAHDEKLIHRDIKPENILVGRRNEILLSDFGIAIVAQSSRYQNPQDMAGTITYMAPEQIQAHPRPASDQYSLGIVVYEWLTGDRPFHGSFTEIAVKHGVVPPPSLREKVPTIPPDVERVVLTALAKEPKERFGSVKAFATALEQASQSEQSSSFAPTIIVKPPTPIVLAPPVTTPAKPSIETPVTPPPAPTPPAMAPPSVGTTFHIYRGHSAKVNIVAWSPDGKYIASGSDDKTVQIWDTASGNEVITYRGHSKIVRAVAWSPHGKFIASGSDDKTVQVWDATSGKKTFTYLGHTWSVHAVRWSPDGEYIVSGSDDITAQVWNAASGRRVTDYRGHSGWIGAVGWSPDGELIASGGYDRLVQVWNATSGSKVFTYRGHSNRVNALAWSPDGKSIGSGDNNGLVQVWDASTGKQVFAYRSHASGVKSITWAPDGKHIASANEDSTVQVWDASSGNRIFTYRGHSGPVNAVAWSPDGKRIASASDDKTVQVWVVP